MGAAYDGRAPLGGGGRGVGGGRAVCSSESSERFGVYVATGVMDWEFREQLVAGRHWALFKTRRTRVAHELGQDVRDSVRSSGR